MKSNFIISGLDPIDFESYFSMDASELEKLGFHTCIVDTYPGYPCRVSLEDAKIGEEVLLMTFEHHPSDSPYRASGPIFVKKNANPANLNINEVPKMLVHRSLSLRAYDEQGMMVDASILTGTELKRSLFRMFENPKVFYIHVHNAGPGCYNCVVRREP